MTFQMRPISLEVPFISAVWVEGRKRSIKNKKGTSGDRRE